MKDAADNLDMRFLEDDTIRYWVTADPGMTQEDRAELEREIDAPDEGVQVQQHGAGPGIMEIAFAFSILANVATTVQATTSAFGKIAKWLQRRKQEGKPVRRIRIERTTVIREKIDLSGDNIADLERFFTGDNSDV